MLFYSYTHDIRAKQLHELNESARKHDIKINYLGVGVGRFNTTMKLKLLYRELCKLDDHDIVCAVDGFDVFFCANEDEITQRFLSHYCDCIISTERAYAHQYEKYRDFYSRTNSTSPYRYINTGSIIGYAGALKNICAPTLSTAIQSRIFTGRNIGKIKTISGRIANSLKIRNFDKNFIYSYVYYTDQQHIGKHIAINPNDLNIKLDYDTSIFWCCAWEWDDIKEHFRVENEKIVNNHTNNDPLIIHVPGWRAHHNVFKELYKTQSSLNRYSVRRPHNASTC